MKVPTMEQLRIRDELEMAQIRAEWEELWTELVTYGRAYGRMLFKESATTETYGRGAAPVITGFWELLTPPEGRDSWFDIRFCACGDSRCRGKLSCYPRSAIADAVSRAVSA
jgi:hypothetical protein